MTNMKKYAALKLVCSNDINGNPRRGWLIFLLDTGASVAFINEGYQGYSALEQNGVTNYVDLGSLEIPLSERKILLNTLPGEV